MENYLYRYPRDLDKELQQFVTFPIVNVAVVESHWTHPQRRISMIYAAIVIDIIYTNGFKCKYTIAASGPDINIFVTDILLGRRSNPSIHLDYNQDPPAQLIYSRDTQELSVVLQRTDSSVANSNAINIIPKDVAKVIIDKLSAILPEYAALAAKLPNDTILPY